MDGSQWKTWMQNDSLHTVPKQADLNCCLDLYTEGVTPQEQGNRTKKGFEISVTGRD